MTKKTFIPIASCMDDREPNVLSVQQALAKIKATLTPIGSYEKCALRTGLGRILAEDIISTINVPSHVNSAMDGYALNGDDLADRGDKGLQVIGTAWAGQPFEEEVQRGQCVRIMTGAVMPTGTDTVIIQERVRREEDTIYFLIGNKKGQNVRQAGEDLSIGQQVLTQGKTLFPPELGLLASLGIAEVKVKRRLRVAFFSTGYELRSIGQTLEKGNVYDSNRYTLYGMLTRLGVDIIDMGVVPDKREALQTAFKTAADQADVVITSGGVSVGEADFVKDTLASLGAIDFWKIAMKPGRPLAFGQLGDAAFFGLPGNPVAVMVTFYQFVQPALHYMMGHAATPSLTYQAKVTTDIPKKPGRTEFLRGVLAQNLQGEWTVERAGKQGSGILRSMSDGNCFIILDTDEQDIQQGDLVTVQPFATFM